MSTKITVLGVTGSGTHPGMHRFAGPPIYRDRVTEELPEGVPRYQKIADALRERIDSGGLPPGALLPSAARISEEWGVSTTTAANALRLLHSEGLTRTAENGEMFVAGPDD